MEHVLYHSYRDHLKKRFKGRIQKVSIDAKFTCPNRDGSKAYGGCTYCNNESFSPATLIRERSVRDQLESGIKFCENRYKNIEGYIAYFQSYSNTYAPLDYLKSIYEEALAVEKVIGLSIGTRPDCIDFEKIQYLSELAKLKDITIEYGLESMYDESLERINRGHNFQCFVDAVNLTKDKGIKIGTHIIIGFPWENEQMWIDTARELSRLPIDYLKIHQLHIVKNTIMGNEYMKKPFRLLSKDEYINVLISFLEHLSPNIVVQRMFGTSPKELTLSEHWPENITQLSALLEKEMLKRNTYQGIKYLQK